MTLQDFTTILTSTELPCRFLSFGANECPDMPFITFFETGSDNFGADGIVYHPIKEMQVDLWTAKKDIASESLLETTLTGAGIFWQKDIDHDDDESCYRVTYTMSI